MDLKSFSYILIFLAFIGQALGGFMDMYSRKKVCIHKKICLSKRHMWQDSIFLILVAIAINVISD